MKKFLAIFMAACLCLSLVACGSGGNAGGNGDDAGGNGEQQKVPLGEHKHVYTTKSSCDLCGEAWNATETDAYTFTPVTIDGVAGYDVTFGVYETFSYPLLPNGLPDYENPIIETIGKPYEEEEIVLPCVHEGKPVISVGNSFRTSSAKVKKIAIPDSIISFGKYGSRDGAFSFCTALEEIVLPYEPNVGGMESYFAGANPLSYGSILSAYSDHHSPLSQSYGEDGGLYIGEYLIDVSADVNPFTIKEGTKGIASGAFFDSKIEEIRIPDSVTELGLSAFNGCSSLKKVTFGENSKLKRIDAFAFANCPITEIDLPDGLEMIGEQAFYATGLTDISIPDSVKRVGAHAFMNTEYERSYFNEQRIYVIDGNELYNGNCLIKVNPDFEGHYTVREGTTAIMGGAFSGCDKITSVTLPEDMTAIDANMFSICLSLKSIELPKRVTTIGMSAFSDTALESIVIPEGVTKIPSGAFGNCVDLKEITLPAGLTEIDERAFIGCGSLKTVVLPNGVTAIGESAFAACPSLEKITIPKSVMSLGMGALYCNALKEIEFGGTMEEWKRVAFYQGSMSGYVNSSEGLIITCSDGKLDQEGNVIEN